MWVWSFFAGAVLVAVAIQLLPNVREGAVMKVAARVGKAAAPAQPGDDWPSLYARLESRDVGNTVGNAAGLLTCGLVFVVAGSRLGDVVFPLVLLIASSFTTIGALLGHLWKVRSSSGQPRLVSLHRREVSDYLTPRELELVRLCVVVPVLALAFGVVMVVQDPDVWVGAVLAGCAALALGIGLLVRPLAQWSLTAPSGVVTPGGLVWAEMLRGILLRDVVSGLWGVVTVASGAVPVFGWMTKDLPPAADALGAVVVGLAVVANLGFAWVSWRDTNHRWARQHAVGGVPS